jgi:hypothetical protein
MLFALVVTAVVLLLCSSYPTMFTQVRGFGVKTMLSGRSFKRTGILSTKLSSARIPLSPKHVSLDATLVAQNLDLVKSHLVARRVDVSAMDKLVEMKSLRLERSQCIPEGDAARRRVKTTSDDIRRLMQAGDGDKSEADIAALKELVHKINMEAMESEQKVRQLDSDIHQLMSGLPNLLDDRCVGRACLLACFCWRNETNCHVFLVIFLLEQSPGWSFGI